MLSIVDRYFLSEITKVFVAIMVSLLLVVISMLFLRTLEEVNVGGLGLDVVLRFLGLQVLRDMSSLLPPAFFLAVLMSLGRMSRDSELVAFTAGGLSPLRIYRSLMLFVLPLSLFTAWLALEIQPWAAGEIHRIRLLQKEQATQIAGLQAGRFYQEQGGTLNVYIRDIDDDGHFQDVFIQDRREKPMRVVLSASGHQRLDPITGERMLVLENGRRYDGEPGTAEYTIATFERYRLRIAPSGRVDQRRLKRTTMPTWQLLGSHELADRAELEHRLSAPLAIFSLVLIGIPLGATSSRQRNTGRLLLAFLAYFAFFNTQRLAETWLADGMTPAWLGSLWYQPLVIAMVYATLLTDSYWMRRVRRRLFGGARPREA